MVSGSLDAAGRREVCHKSVSSWTSPTAALHAGSGSVLQ